MKYKSRLTESFKEKAASLLFVESLTTANGEDSEDFVATAGGEGSGDGDLSTVFSIFSGFANFSILIDDFLLLLRFLEMPKLLTTPTGFASFFHCFTSLRFLFAT